MDDFKGALKEFFKKVLKGMYYVYIVCAWLGFLVYVGMFFFDPESRPLVLSSFWWTLPSLFVAFYLLGKL